jgi:hypothetical protein
MCKILLIGLGTKIIGNIKICNDIDCHRHKCGSS